MRNYQIFLIKSIVSNSTVDTLEILLNFLAENYSQEAVDSVEDIFEKCIDHLIYDSNKIKTDDENTDELFLNSENL